MTFDGPSDSERFLIRAQEIAAEINREHPDWSLSRRLGEAMKRTKGSVNPKMMREWLAPSEERKP